MECSEMSIGSPGTDSGASTGIWLLTNICGCSQAVECVSAQFVCSKGTF